MIVDHIKYLKTAVEGNIRDRAGTGFPLAKKFLEIYPKPATIVKSVPCAAAKYIPMGTPKVSGMWDRRSATETQVTKVRRMYDTKSTYQVDIFSNDIYDFYERDGTYKGFLSQLVDYVGLNQFVANPGGDGIRIECGVHGIIDDEDLIVDGVYKAFCQVIFSDGIYKTTVAPRITGVNLSEGEMRDG